LPGSRAVLYTAHTAATGDYDNANIEIVSFRTGERKTLQRGGFSPHYVSTSGASGYLIYLNRSTLFAAPFDLNRIALTGAPVPILEDANSSLVGGGDFAFAQNGNFIYLSGGRTTPGYPILWLDSTGKTQPFQSRADVYFTPRFSPDGKRLAFVTATAHGSDISVRELDRDIPRRLTFLPGQNVQPVWTPDGENIVFRLLSPTAAGLYMIRSNGSGEPRRLTDGKLQETPYSFSPDGKRLAFYALGTGGSFDIYTAAMEGDSDHPRLGKPDVFLSTSSSEISPAFSPDGRWLAYASNQSGTFETYVRAFPGPGGQWQISSGGGQLPVWSRNGRELLFRALDGRIMAVGYRASSDLFNAYKPRAWSDVRVRFVGNLSTYDLAPDGKRVVMLPSEETSSDRVPARLTFLFNFSDQVERLASGGKR
jgi:serine/threonine-protein kinase